MQIPCPSCRLSLALPDDAVGRKAQCPSCQAVFLVAAGPIAPEPAIVSADRTDAVSCPGCDRRLAFGQTTAGQVIICPSCSRRVRMPTASEMSRDGRTTTQSSAEAQPGFELLSTPPQPTMRRGAGPYEAPMTPGSYAAQTNYAIPGRFLLVMSSLNLAMDILWGTFMTIGLLAPGNNQGDIGGVIMMFGWVTTSLLAHGLTFYAGLKMTQRRSLAMARIGAIVGIIPCGVCAVLQIPFGIWATVVLFNSNAPDDFDKLS